MAFRRAVQTWHPLDLDQPSAETLTRSTPNGLDWFRSPSLRRQLQHVTEEMSRYYARGSACAKNLIGEYKHHFGREWQEAQPVSAAMSYLYNVLLTDEVLFGAHGNWVENRFRSADHTVSVDRRRLCCRFKKGELAYRETSLGGCASTETCDKLPIGWLNIECVKGCKNFVGRLPKLEQAISAQAETDPSSIEIGRISHQWRPRRARKRATKCGNEQRSSRR